MKAIKKRRKEKQEREGVGCFPKGGDVLVYELISLSPSISLSLSHTHRHTLPPSLSHSRSHSVSCSNTLTEIGSTKQSRSLTSLQKHTHRHTLPRHAHTSSDASTHTFSVTAAELKEKGKEGKKKTTPEKGRQEVKEEEKIS